DVSCGGPSVRGGCAGRDPGAARPPPLPPAADRHPEALPPRPPLAQPERERFAPVEGPADQAPQEEEALVPGRTRVRVVPFRGLGGDAPERHEVRGGREE